MLKFLSRGIVTIVWGIVLACPSASTAADWTSMAGGTSNALYGVWGNTPNNVFAVGANSTILHYNGTSWTPMTIDGVYTLYDIWGSSESDVFAVGTNGTVGIILHYDGNAWSQLLSGGHPLHGVWGTSGNNVFFIGEHGMIFHVENGNWTSMTFGTSNLYDIWGSAADTIFAVGSNGTILRYNGSNWQSMSGNTSETLYGVWGTTGMNVFWGGTLTLTWLTPGNNVFAVGDNGTILHYDGNSWTTMSNSASDHLRSIWGNCGISLFTIGDSGEFGYYNSGCWTFTFMDSGTDQNLYSVWGSSTSDVFAVGENGTILHYPVPQYTLMVSKTGTGGGTVTSDPAGIECGVNCVEPYTSGTQVTLTATPNAWSSFAGWSSGDCSGPGTCTAAIAANTTVTATFTAATATETISGVIRNSTGLGIPGVVLKGSADTITTDSAGAYTLNINSGWSGTLTPEKPGYTFAPASHTYTNVTSNQTNQNSTGTLTGRHYFQFDEWGGTWHDAEKGVAGVWGTCWNASSANVLTWGGWAPTFGSTQDAFRKLNEYWGCCSAFRSSQPALIWWFAGDKAVSELESSELMLYSSTIRKPGGGNYWPGANFQSKFYASNDLPNIMDIIAAKLHEGWGISFLVSMSIPHWLTAWGYESVANGNYTGIWITDNEDGEVGVLRLLPVEYDHFSTRWNLPTYIYEGISGGFYVGPIEALKRNAPYTISGDIRTASGEAISDVVLYGLPGNPKTDSNGFYSTTVLSDWSGTAIPKKTGYAFTPANRNYTNVTTIHTNQNYTSAEQLGNSYLLWTK